MAQYHSHKVQFSVENERTWRRKLNFIADRKLAGVYLWRLDTDDFEVIWYHEKSSFTIWKFV